MNKEIFSAEQEVSLTPTEMIQSTADDRNEGQSSLQQFESLTHNFAPSSTIPVIDQEITDRQYQIKEQINLEERAGELRQNQDFEEILDEPSPPQLLKKIPTGKPPIPTLTQQTPWPQQQAHAESQNDDKCERRINQNRFKRNKPSNESIDEESADPCQKLLTEIRNYAEEKVRQNSTSPEFDPPTLHQLLKAFDSVLSEYESQNKESMFGPEVQNKVYRVLIKTEKERAYQSILSIQSEIFDIEDSTSLGNPAYKSVERSSSQPGHRHGESGNFTFARDEHNQSLEQRRINHLPITSQPNFQKRRENSKNLIDKDLVQNAYASDSEITTTQKKKKERPNINKLSLGGPPQPLLIPRAIQTGQNTGTVTSPRGILEGELGNNFGEPNSNMVQGGVNHQSLSMGNTAPVSVDHHRQTSFGANKNQNQASNKSQFGGGKATTTNLDEINCPTQVSSARTFIQESSSVTHIGAQVNSASNATLRTIRSSQNEHQLVQRQSQETPEQESEVPNSDENVDPNPFYRQNPISTQVYHHPVFQVQVPQNPNPNPILVLNNEHMMVSPLSVNHEDGNLAMQMPQQFYPTTTISGTLTTQGFELIENLISLQKNRSFMKRCEKLMRIRNTERQERAIDQNTDNSMCTFGGEELNQDLSSIRSTSKKRSLPRIRLSKVRNPFDTSDSSDEKNGKENNAIDSNKAIVVAYRVQLLLSKVLRSLETHSDESKAKKFLKEESKHRYKQLLLKTAFNRFYSFYKSHKGYVKAKMLAQRYFKLHFGMIYLKRWHQKTQIKMKVEEKLSIGSKIMGESKLRRLFKSWRTAMLSQKMTQIKREAVSHIHQKRLLCASFTGLTAFMRYSIRAKYQDGKAREANRQRLQFRAFKLWQKFILERIQSHDLRQLACQMRAISLQRVVFNRLREAMAVQEHKRQIVSCADSYRALCFTRRAMQALKVWVTVSKRKRDQSQNIRKFYETNLKLKFMRFIHEQNLEFIQHAVKVEEYFQRRRKRDVLRILTKYARVENTLSCFVKMPTPEMIYQIHFWLRKIHGEYQSRHSFTSLCVQKRHSRKYQLKQQNADVLLQDYVLTRVIVAWKNYTRQSLRLRQKQSTRLIDQCFTAWILWWNKQAKRNSKLKKFKVAGQIKLKLRILRAIRLQSAKQKNDRKMTKQVVQTGRKIRLSGAFQLWSTKFREIDRKRTLKSLQHKFRLKSTFKRCFCHWQMLYNQLQKKQDVKMRGKMVQREIVKRKFFCLWMSQFQSKINLQNKDLKVTSARYKDLKHKVIIALRWNADSKRYWRDLEIQVSNSHKEKMVRKCIEAWKRFAPEMVQKHALVDEVVSDFQRKTKTKIFTILNQHRQFSVERKVTDALMTKEIHLLRSKKFLREWKSLSFKRQGLQIFAESFERIKAAHSFRKMVLLRQIQCQKQEDIGLFLEFNKVRLCFQALQIYTKKRDRQAWLIRKCQDNYEQIIQRKVFSILSQKVMQRRASMIEAAKVVIELKNQMLQKCFSALKYNFELIKKGKQILISLNKKCQKKSFEAFKINYLRNTLVKASLFRRNQMNKEDIFVSWRNLIQERAQIQEFTLRKDLEFKYKIFEAFLHQIRVQQRKKFLLEEGQFVSQQYLLRRTLYMLGQYAEDQIQKRFRKKQAVFFAEENIKARNFRILSLCTKKSSQLKLVSKKQENLTLKRKQMLVLGAMISVSSNRIRKYKAALKVVQSSQKVENRLIFSQFIEGCAFAKQMDFVAEAIENHRKAKQLQLGYYTLKQYAARKIQKRKFEEQIVQDACHSKFAKVFYSLKTEIESLKIKRENKEVAETYLQDRLKRKALQGIRLKAFQRKRARKMYEFIVKSRLIPKVWAVLRENSSLQKTKRSLKNIGNKLRSRTLKSKSFTALKQKVYKGRASHKLKKKAILFRQKRLLDQSFNSLVKGCKHLKERSQRRNIFEITLKRISNNLILEKAFLELREACRYESIQNSRKVVSFNPIKLKLVLKEWRKYQERRNMVKDLGQQLTQLSHRNTLKTYLATWAQSLQEKNQIWFVSKQYHQKLAQKAFDSLKLIRYLKRASQNALLWREDSLKRAFFSGCLFQIDTRKKLARVFVQIQEQTSFSLKTKTLLSLRYNVVMKKGLAVLKAKQDLDRQTKALNALKYHTVSQRVTQRYVSFIQQKSLRKLFTQWRQRYETQIASKVVLQPIIQRLFDQKRALAIKKWRKYSKRVHLFRSIQKVFIQEHQIKMAILAFYEWRKMAKFFKNKEYLKNELVLIREQKTKQHVFQVWFNGAKKRAPISMLTSTVDNSLRKIELRRGLQAILEQSIFDEDIECVAIQQEKTREWGLAKNCLQVWVKALKVRQISNKVAKIHNQKSQEKFFAKWIEVFDIQRQQKAQDDLEEAALIQAGALYDGKLTEKVFRNLVLNLVEERELHHAEIMHEQKLLEKGFKGLEVYLEGRDKRNMLRLKVDKVQDKVGKRLLQEYYDRWIEQFDEQISEKAIIQQFQEGIQKGRLTNCVKALKEYASRKIDLREKYEDTFRQVEQSSNLRLKYETFKQMQTKCVHLRIKREKELRALQVMTAFNEDSLIVEQNLQQESVVSLQKNVPIDYTTVSQLMRPSAEKSSKESMSKMCSVFQAWKFYAKERSLLKKYLFQCGQSASDMSLLTTIEMREEAQRHNSAQDYLPQTTHPSFLAVAHENAIQSQPRLQAGSQLSGLFQQQALSLSQKNQSMVAFDSRNGHLTNSHGPQNSRGNKRANTPTPPPFQRITPDMVDNSLVKRGKTPSVISISATNNLLANEDQHASQNDQTDYQQTQI